MATYPGAVFAVPTRNTGDVIQPAFFNDPNNEIIAIEQGCLNGFQHTLKPFTDATFDIGSATLRWRDIYFSRFIKDANGNTLVGETATASAVDYLNITNGAAGSPGVVTVSALGTDANINLNFVSKGTGVVQINGVAPVILQGRRTAAVNYSNSSAENTLLDVTIPANTLGTTGMIEFCIYGWFEPGGAANKTFTFNVKYGGTTFSSIQTQTIGQDASQYGYHIIGTLNAAGATNSQRGVATLVGLAKPTDGTANTNLAASVGVTSERTTAITIDSTLAQHLLITVTMSVADNANQVQADGAWVRSF